MVEKMQAVLETFASYGSGWVLQHVIQVFVKLAKFSPIHGSSYIDLPFRFRMSQTLINIRNHEGNNCFELCFTAAYSLKHGVDLLLTDQQKANPAAARKQLDTYTAESAQKAQGNFDSPMSFASIGKFEQLNDVRVCTTRESCCLCIYQKDQTKITAPKLKHLTWTCFSCVSLQSIIMYL